MIKITTLTVAVTSLQHLFAQFGLATDNCVTPPSLCLSKLECFRIYIVPVEPPASTPPILVVILPPRSFPHGRYRDTSVEPMLFRECCSRLDADDVDSLCHVYLRR